MIRLFGNYLIEQGKTDTLLAACAHSDIPVIVPGFSDGGWGAQIFTFWNAHRDFTYDIMEDQLLLSNLTFGGPLTAALMIGGGISKHHTIWWNQFADGLNWAVYITTAVEYDGSLSGARLPEAVSWGKVEEKAPTVTMEGEASLILPLLAAGLLFT